MNSSGNRLCSDEVSYTEIESLFVPLRQMIFAAYLMAILPFLLTSKTWFLLSNVLSS